MSKFPALFSCHKFYEYNLKNKSINLLYCNFVQFLKREFMIIYSGNTQTCLGNLPVITYRIRWQFLTPTFSPSNFTSLFLPSTFFFSTLLGILQVVTYCRSQNYKWQNRKEYNGKMNWAPVPARPPSPFTALLQTTPIGIGIGYRGGRWVRQRV